MIRWICNVKLEDHVASDALLKKLDINSVSVIMHRNRLRWYGHVERSNGWIHQITRHVVEGGVSKRGRPMKTWKETVNNDIRDRKLKNINPTDRLKWRNSVWAAMKRPTPDGKQRC